MNGTDGRVLRVLSALSETGFGARRGSLCNAAVRLVGVSGAAVSVVADGRFGGTTLCRSDAVVDRLEAIQMTVGEGPGRDADRTGRPVLEPDLAGASPSRWPAFTETALAAGAKAVFAFPLRIGAIRVGVLGLYRAAPGPLGDEGFGDVLLLADYSAQLILSFSTKAPPGGLDELVGPVALRAEVHQATGMVAVQLGVGVAEAFVRMQAKAFADGRLIGDVAADIVARRLRLDTTG